MAIAVRVANSSMGSTRIMGDAGVRQTPKRLAAQTAKPRTKREQREESYEKLLNAARSLFLGAGYRSTTLERVASQAGLTKGAVYFHFRSKERLLLTLLDRLYDAVIIPTVEPLISVTGTAGDKLIRFTHAHAALGLSHRDDLMLLIALSVEFSQKRGAVNTRIKQIYQLIYDRLEEVIETGQRKGELRCNAPAREMASIVVANHDGAFLEWYRRGGQLNGDHLVRAVRALLVEGIIVRKPEA